MENKDIVLLVDKGSRFPLMIIEGLLYFKNIHLTVYKSYYLLGKILIESTSIDIIKKKLLECDFIFRAIDLHFSPHQEINQFMDENNLWIKCIIIDFEDGCRIRNSMIYKKSLIYFKRSWLIGKERKYPPKRNKAFPLNYSILNVYLTILNNYNPVRDIDVLFVASNDLIDKLQEFRDLRIPINRLIEQQKIPTVIGKLINIVKIFRMARSKKFKILKRTFQLYCPKTRREKTHFELLRANIPNSLIGVNTGGMHDDIFLSPVKNNWVKYLHYLKRAKILFTALPDLHDGDSRTFEAMCSGALVFMDETLINPHPLKDGEHLFIFNASSRKSIKKAIKKAKYYLNPNNRRERESLASAGKEYAIKYHMPKNRIEYIFQCINRVK